MAKTRPNGGVIGAYNGISTTSKGVYSAVDLQVAKATGGPLANYSITYLVVAGGGAGGLSLIHI